MGESPEQHWIQVDGGDSEEPRMAFVKAAAHERSEWFDAGDGVRCAPAVEALERQLPVSASWIHDVRNFGRELLAGRADEEGVDERGRRRVSVRLE